MDTAYKIADLSECLQSTSNRVDIAKLLLREGKDDLLYTALEDLYYGMQLILDNYCVENPK